MAAKKETVKKEEAKVEKKPAQKKVETVSIEPISDIREYGLFQYVNASVSPEIASELISSGRAIPSGERAKRASAAVERETITAAINRKRRELRNERNQKAREAINKALLELVEKAKA